MSELFIRPHHQHVARLLGQLDGGLLTRFECYFAGGTAIALQLGEFRRSDDIDFLCASAEGYRQLRVAVFREGLQALGAELPVLRPARADQYGVRGVLGTAEAPVKFEVVREARIDLDGGDAMLCGVPLLNRTDLYAEKLLANADRGLDTSTLHRDLIDLCVMVRRWGPIPDEAMAKAESAYGSTIAASVGKVAALLQDPSRLCRALSALDAEESAARDVSDVLASYRANGLPALLK